MRLRLKSRPWCRPPSIPGPDLHAQDRGQDRRRLPGQDLQAPDPNWPPTPTSHQQPGDRAPPSGANTSPTPATKGSSAPCSCPPSPHCAPTPSPRPTTCVNATKAKRHNQAVLTLAHRRILTLHTMIHNGILYGPQPATKLPTALTHHIGLPGARRAYASYKTSHNKDERLDSTTRPTKPVRPATAPETPRPAAPAPVGRQTNASQPSTQPRFRLIPDLTHDG